MCKQCANNVQNQEGYNKKEQPRENSGLKRVN